MPIQKVKKRNGQEADFDRSKIKNAILRALEATGSRNSGQADRLTGEVVAKLEAAASGPAKLPGIEDIQDIVEQVLMDSGYTAAAKAYILYRQKHTQLRSAKRALGGWDHEELKLDLNAITILERRYLLKDSQGNITESPSGLFRRVARAIASVDSGYGHGPFQTENIFYRMMASREFLPNSPTLMNAGTPLGILSACFVLPIDDSLDSIFKTLWDAAKIHQGGGGTGFSFSRLRPGGDLVQSTKGVASGPLTFMTIFDKETDVIKQGGKRRGANMGILRVDHPDIMDFITAKENPEFLHNFNLSVGVTDNFMEAVKQDKEYPLINPRTKKITRKLRAKDVWDLIATYAWKTGDPGVVFIDEINRQNPTSHLGKIEATNPCGEQPLQPYDSCNLGSINLTAMVKEKRGSYTINWDKLRNTVWDAVHFLDNVIDANNYLVPEVEETTKKNRRVGLGVMGFADLLCLLGIPYNSKKALSLGEKIIEFINQEAHKKSSQLGKARGNFPGFRGSKWEKQGYKWMRNATVTTIAPTGTISIIAGCSSGIEPLFAAAFVRNVLEGSQIFEVNPVLEMIGRKRGFWSSNLVEKIAATGTLKRIDSVPEDIKRVFVTALEIDPQWHIRMQAAFQKHCDNAVSKTINFPMEASVEGVRNSFFLAYQLKCKGVTVYRYGSKPDQVLSIGEIERKRQAQTTPPPFVVAGSEFAGGCPSGTCPAPS